MRPARYFFVIQLSNSRERSGSGPGERFMKQLWDEVAAHLTNIPCRVILNKRISRISAAGTPFDSIVIKFPRSRGAGGALHLQSALAGVMLCPGHLAVKLPCESGDDVWVLRNGNP